MASVQRSQPKELSHRVTTAPMNDHPVELITITNDGGVAGEDSMGSISTARPSEDH